MIITAGTLKFKRVSLSKKSRLRPTSNKVRQALFNILKHKFDMQRWQKNFTMLDAFAGSGIVSFEAFSRGVSHITLVEKDPKVFFRLQENIRRFQLCSRINALNEDFLNIKNLAFKYKLVYLDPPYNKNIANAALDKIMDINILKKDSIIIIETEKNFIIKNSMQKYIIYTKLYGNIKLNFLRYT